MTQPSTHSSVNASRTRGLRPFPKGVSGNPAGRPKSKGLVQHIRTQTRHGRLLVTFMTRVLRGQRVKSAGRWVHPTLKDRMEAANWLADRGFGRPISTRELAALIPLQTPMAVDARQLHLHDMGPLTDTERTVARKLIQRATQGLPSSMEVDQPR